MIDAAKNAIVKAAFEVQFRVEVFFEKHSKWLILHEASQNTHKCRESFAVTYRPYISSE